MSFYICLIDNLYYCLSQSVIVHCCFDVSRGRTYKNKNCCNVNNWQVGNVRKETKYLYWV